MKPLGDYIFIGVEDIKEKATASGIILAGEIAREGAQTGTVVAVGPEVKAVKVGQKVVFNEHQYDHLFSDKETNQKIMVGKVPGVYAYAE